MSDTTDQPRLSAAERLAIGGDVAPALRRRAGSGRRITVVDREGKPVRVTDDVEIAKGLLARSAIEFSVVDGKRPAFVNCKTCGRPIKTTADGALPKVCRAGTYRCACGKPLGAPGCRFGGTCKKCSVGKAMANLRAAVEASAKMTPEQRSERSRRAQAAMSPEKKRKRRERAAKCGKAVQARLSPEERSERARKRRADQLAARRLTTDSAPTP